MISLSFWTILKSRTNSKKANKSSNTKQDILDIDIKRALGIDPKALFSMCIGDCIFCDSHFVIFGQVSFVHSLYK